MKGRTEYLSCKQLARSGLMGVVRAAGIALLPLIIANARAQETAPTETVLHTFTGEADGGYPFATLISDAGGNLYGTTAGGGNTSSSCAFGSTGCGVVFKLDPAGIETVLYTFAGGADGANPYTGLIRDAAGDLYGTTYFGGNTSSSCFSGLSGCGVVFKLDPEGNETVLHAFTGGADGWGSVASLIRDAAGNLYGTAQYGGNTGSSCPFAPLGCGVVFKLDPAGTETVLHTFSGGADGAIPLAGLIRDSAGDLYGTAGAGGDTSSSCPNGSAGCGVVFELEPLGQHYRVLYVFTGGADGGGPKGGLLRDAAGNLYGTTSYGGNTGSSCPNGSYGCGVVFKLDPLGNETVLYTFTGGADGWGSVASLTRDAAGNLYGTTQYGGDTSSSCPLGSLGCGVVFKLDPAGKETVLYTFTGGPDGAQPVDCLLSYKGSLYGTADGGGAYGAGVVFKLH